MLYAMLSMHRPTFSMCCLVRSTCSYACSHASHLDLHFYALYHVCILRSMFLHAYIFRSTFLGFYAMFPLFCSSLCFVLMLGLCAHMLDIMSIVMLCSNLCVHELFVMFYA